ncbi:AraC family transcriptional regulator [Flavobacterium sp. RNTU_13]|uniref:AraC family transcriptional regulator n=1 Tax=Flavobacterium sp. RNTU_13 TaxID=3375145 RepID=UPI003988627A
MNTSVIDGIIYSCYTRLSREGENFIPFHVFNYVESGTLRINDGKNEYVLNAGDSGFYVRNQLAKFSKMPGADGSEYKSLSIRIDSNVLQGIKLQHTNALHKPTNDTAVIKLDPNPLYAGYAQSLIAYLNSGAPMTDALKQLKVNEIALLLLQTKPELAGILLDVSEPGKIDLKDFMQRNFRFNVPLERFAYLTGRSLSTFKRDFQKLFGSTPSRWLQQKRLEEALYRITQKGEKVSDVYIEVGFENLSHFSFAFKKAFGKAPTQLF